MRTIRFFLLLIVVTFQLPCQKRTTIKATAIGVSGRVVVIFGPREAQYDSALVDKTSLTDTLYTKFRLAAEHLRPFLGQHNVGFIATSASSIQVRWNGKPFRLVPADEDPPVGMILSDGTQEPKVISGTRTESELLEEIRLYFQLE